MDRYYLTSNETEAGNTNAFYRVTATTMRENVISRQDIETFHNDGFVIKLGVLGTQAHQIAAWTDEIADWPEISGKYMMYFETSVVCSGERLLSRIESLSRGFS